MQNHEELEKMESSKSDTAKCSVLKQRWQVLSYLDAKILYVEV